MEVQHGAFPMRDCPTHQFNYPTRSKQSVTPITSVQRFLTRADRSSAPSVSIVGRDGTSARSIISPQTSYRLANRNYAGGAEESDEHEVALRRRKTNTKRTQRRERGQLSQP